MWTTAVGGPLTQKIGISESDTPIRSRAYDPDVRERGNYTRQWFQNEGGGLFQTDDVGQGGGGVQEVSFWSDDFDG